MVAIEESAFYEDTFDKIGSLIESYGNTLSYDVQIGLTIDSFRFPITLPEQIPLIVAGVDRRYINDQSIRIELSYFWEDQETLRRGLTTHQRFLTIAEATGNSVLQLIQPEQPSMNIISLASIRVIVFKTNEIELADDDYDICDCGLCAI